MFKSSLYSNTNGNLLNKSIANNNQQPTKSGINGDILKGDMQLTVNSNKQSQKYE